MARSVESIQSRCKHKVQHANRQSLQILSYASDKEEYQLAVFSSLQKQAELRLGLALKSSVCSQPPASKQWVHSRAFSPVFILHFFPSFRQQSFCSYRSLLSRHKAWPSLPGLHSKQEGKCHHGCASVPNLCLLRSTTSDELTPDAAPRSHAAHTLIAYSA